MPIDSSAADSTWAWAPHIARTTSTGSFPGAPTRSEPGDRFANPWRTSRRAQTSGPVSVEPDVEVGPDRDAAHRDA
jgi:hypothetical protein